MSVWYRTCSVARCGGCTHGVAGGGEGRNWATVLSRTNKQECPDAQQCGREWYDGQSANPPAHPRPHPLPRSLLERQPKRRQVPAG